MSQLNYVVAKEFLQPFADIFNARDITAIMSYMTDDCISEASAGTDFDREKFVGQGQVKNSYRKNLL